MTVHLVRRRLPAGALSCVGPGDTIVLFGQGGDPGPLAGVRSERAAGPGATLDDAALIALLFEAARVITW